ncbi:MAG: DUF2703 domain-containing protein [Elusimicrobia bacterium]|nr:DUF2703 domain-containing protein [Elusimicrobiota bacterium]
MKIHLLYFKGCPNVEQARKNLRMALSHAGLAPTWKEIDVQSKKTPRAWRGFPSPTILINGREINTGAATVRGATACRFGGAPSIPQIMAVLRANGRIIKNDEDA